MLMMLWRRGRSGKRQCLGLLCRGRRRRLRLRWRRTFSGGGVVGVVGCCEGVGGVVGVGSYGVYGGYGGYGVDR